MLKKSAVVFASFFASLLFFSCAEKKIKIWIDPPLGVSLRERDSDRVVYQIEDLHSGKKENLSIPVEQVSENLVVERQPQSSSSYLVGVAEIEKLHSQGKYSDALIRIAPLIDQYPSQSRLYLMQGTLLRKMGEKTLAVESFEKAARLDSGNSMIEDALDRFKDDSNVEVYAGKNVQAGTGVRSR